MQYPAILRNDLAFFFVLFFKKQNKNNATWWVLKVCIIYKKHKDYGVPQTELESQTVLINGLTFCFVLVCTGFCDIKKYLDYQLAYLL